MKLLFIEKTTFADPAPEAVVVTPDPPVTVIPTPPVPLTVVRCTASGQYFNHTVMVFSVTLSGKLTVDVVVHVILTCTKVGGIDSWGADLTVPAGTLIVTKPINVLLGTRLLTLPTYSAVQAYATSCAPNPAGGTTVELHSTLLEV